MSSSQHPQEQWTQAESASPPQDLGEHMSQSQPAHQPVTAESSKGKRRKSKGKSKAEPSGSETETEAPKMPSSSKSSSPSGPSKKHGSSSRLKTEDWTEVTDPEERRRIQNRIAQRKFRGKAKEQREKNERDQRNREHAGDSYRVPEPGDIPCGEDAASLSGLPWGGVNMHYMVARGPEGGGSAGAAAHGSPVLSEQLYGDAGQFLSPYSASYQYTGSWDGQDASSGGDEQLYYDDGATSFYYDYDASPTQ